MTSGSGIDAYFLCATPRTGSTLLCNLLESSGVAGHPESYFRRQGLDEYTTTWGLPRRRGRLLGGVYIQAARSAGRTANGVFGARIMAETLPELTGELAALTPDPAASDLTLLTRTFGEVRFVHLGRCHSVAQAVAWARAEQTHFWHPGEVMVPGGQRPQYDADLIKRLIADIAVHEARWQAWFAAHDVVPHEVVYEDLAADPAATARGVLAYLDLEIPRGISLRSDQRRQADAVNQEWITRFTPS